MSAATEYLSFSIHGDYMTNLFRNIFLEEGYQKVYDIFSKSFCTQMDVKYLNDILACKNKLIGINDLDYVEDSWDDNPEYKRDYDYRFAGLVYLNKRYYKPYAIINSWLQADFTYASSNWSGQWREPCYFRPLQRYCTFNEVRSYYYVKDRDRKYEIFTDNHTVYIFEETTDFDIPYWMCEQFKRSLKDALVDYKEKNKRLIIIDPIAMLSEQERYVEASMAVMETEADLKQEHSEQTDEEDFVQKHKEAREEFAKQYALKSYERKILEQNGDDWVEIKYEIDGTEKVLRVPAKPFHHWCIGSGRLMDVPDYDKNVKKIAPWTPVSPLGSKMINDNVYHTDWVIGAGFDPEEWYINTQDDKEYEAIDNAIYRYAFDFQIGLKKKRAKRVKKNNGN